MIFPNRDKAVEIAKAMVQRKQGEENIPQGLKAGWIEGFRGTTEPSLGG